MEEKKAVYTIRKDGKIYFQSEEVNCGYSAQLLREMEKAGYHLYKDGKRVKSGGKTSGRS